MTRLQFFIDHIGKPVFIPRNGCTSELWERWYQHGLIVEDLTHASYLASIEAETNITYYGSIEERNDSENIIPDSQTYKTA